MSILETGNKALLFVAVIQGLFLAVLVYLRVRQHEGRILVALLLVFTLNSALDLVESYVSNLPWLLPLYVTVLLLIGPLGLTYFEAVAQPERPGLSKDSRRHWLFSAAMGSALLGSLLPYYSVWRDLVAGHIGPLVVVAFLAVLLVGALVAANVQQGLCLWSAHRRLSEAKAGLQHDSPRDARLTWLDLLVRVLLVLWIVSVATLWGSLVFHLNEVTSYIGTLLYALAIYGLSGFALLNPEAFKPPRKAVQEMAEALVKYRKSALTPADVTRLLGKLEQEMQRTQAWREGSLSLAALSKRIGASPNDVSQAINQGTGTGFYDYVNRYRIEDAKLLLLEPGGHTVLEIAYQVGFNSKSAFNTAFRKQTGATPTSFRAGQASSPIGSNDEDELQPPV